MYCILKFTSRSVHFERHALILDSVLRVRLFARRWRHLYRVLTQVDLDVFLTIQQKSIRTVVQFQGLQEVSCDTQHYELPVHNTKGLSSVIPVKGPFHDPQLHPPFFPKNLDFTSLEAFRYMICMCKIFLANSFVWWNDQQIGDLYVNMKNILVT